jgi:hypothetical protein
MVRLITLLSAVSLIMLPSRTAPFPNPSRDGNNYYYPVKKGSKWTYVLSKDKDTSYAETVAEVEEKEGEFRLKFGGGEVLGIRLPVRILVVSKAGLRNLGDRESKDQWLLKLPAKSGDSWKSKERYRGIDATVVRTIRDVELIEVPAGKYKAIRVDSEITLLDTVLKLTSWYTPGVGLVKETADFAEEDVWVLSSFDLGP